MAQNYSDFKVEFFDYMKSVGHKRKLWSDYNSWLDFINDYHKLNTELNETKIEYILSDLDAKRNERNIYKKKEDISNFRSALNKFLAFLKADYVSSWEDIKNKEDKEEIDKINRDTKIPNTEKEILIKARDGQGIYRIRILKMFNSKCLISKFSNPKLLVASHIKPWCKSTNEERLDKNNGLLLLPTYDKLFDKGLISFNQKGEIMISKSLTNQDIEVLGIPLDFSYNFNNSQLKYIEYHFNNIFISI